METKFWHQSRAITQLKNNENKFVIVLAYTLSVSMHLQNLIIIHQLAHKILSINEISTSIKGNNSVENERKILFNHPNLHLININAYTNFEQNHKLIHKILSINKILTSTKGHNSVKSWPKITCIRYNIHVDLVYINAYTKLYQNSFHLFCNIEEKHIFTPIKGHNSVVYKRI